MSIKNKELRIVSACTPDGDFNIIIDENEVAIASGFGCTKELIKKLQENFSPYNIKNVDKHPYQKLIEKYYSKDKLALSKIPRRQKGTNFQMKVWDEIDSIPYGQTASYKQLTHKTGRPKASRAVGNICGLNRLALLIPCHRVIKSDGTNGNYAYGKDIKKSLLVREARINNKD